MHTPGALERLIEPSSRWREWNLFIGLAFFGAVGVAGLWLFNGSSLLFAILAAAAVLALWRLPRTAGWVAALYGRQSPTFVEIGTRAQFLFGRPVRVPRGEVVSMIEREYPGGGRAGSRRYWTYSVRSGRRRAWFVLAAQVEPASIAAFERWLRTAGAEFSFEAQGLFGQARYSGDAASRETEVTDQTGVTDPTEVTDPIEFRAPHTQPFPGAPEAWQAVWLPPEPGNHARAGGGKWLDFGASPETFFDLPPRSEPYEMTVAPTKPPAGWELVTTAHHRRYGDLLVVMTAEGEQMLRIRHRRGFNAVDVYEEPEGTGVRLHLRDDS